MCQPISTPSGHFQKKFCLWKMCARGLSPGYFFPFPKKLKNIFFGFIKIFFQVFRAVGKCVPANITLFRSFSKKNFANEKCAQEDYLQAIFCVFQKSLKKYFFLIFKFFFNFFVRSGNVCRPISPSSGHFQKKFCKWRKCARRISTGHFLRFPNKFKKNFFLIF